MYIIEASASLEQRGYAYEIIDDETGEGREGFKDYFCHEHVQQQVEAGLIKAQDQQVFEQGVYSVRIDDPSAGPECLSREGYVLEGILGQVYPEELDPHSWGRDFYDHARALGANVVASYCAVGGDAGNTRLLFNQMASVAGNFSDEQFVPVLFQLPSDHPAVLIQKGAQG